MSEVITWSTPSGDTVNITPEQQEKLEAARKWPRNDRGEEYCQVSYGLHDGESTLPDEYLL